jgi:hypothetical protein
MTTEEKISVVLCVLWTVQFTLAVTFLIASCL